MLAGMAEDWIRLSESLYDRFGKGRFLFAALLLIGAAIWLGPERLAALNAPPFVLENLPYARFVGAALAVLFVLAWAVGWVATAVKRSLERMVGASVAARIATDMEAGLHRYLDTVSDRTKRFIRNAVDQDTRCFPVSLKRAGVIAELLEAEMIYRRPDLSPEGWAIYCFRREAFEFFKRNRDRLAVQGKPPAPKKPKRDSDWLGLRDD